MSEQKVIRSAEDANPLDIQEITTAELRQILVDRLNNLSDLELEDLIETGNFEASNLLPGGRFRLQSNCDGTHFLVHTRHRDVQWPPKCIQPPR